MQFHLKFNLQPCFSDRQNCLIYSTTTVLEYANLFIFSLTQYNYMYMNHAQSLKKWPLFYIKLKVLLARSHVIEIFFYGLLTTHHRYYANPPSDAVDNKTVSLWIRTVKRADQRLGKPSLLHRLKDQKPGKKKKNWNAEDSSSYTLLNTECLRMQMINSRMKRIHY